MGHVGAGPHGRVARSLRLELRSREAPGGLRRGSATASTGTGTCSPSASPRSASSRATARSRPSSSRAIRRADPHVGLALEHFANGFVGGDLSAVFPRNRLSYGFSTGSRFPRRAARASVSISTCAGWSGASGPISGSGRAIPPSALLMPVDTHIENMARSIGLTRRRSRTWRMVEELTAALRRARSR